MFSWKFMMQCLATTRINIVGPVDYCVCLLLLAAQIASLSALPGQAASVAADVSMDKDENQGRLVGDDE